MIDFNTFNEYLAMAFTRLKHVKGIVFHATQLTTTNDGESYKVKYTAPDRKEIMWFNIPADVDNSAVLAIDDEAGIPENLPANKKAVLRIAYWIYSNYLYSD